MQASMKVEIITPYGKIFDDNAKYIKVPGKEGDFGILPKHMELFSILKEGTIKITKMDGADETVLIDWGYIKVDKDSVSVLVDNAIEVEGKDSSTISKNLQKARKTLDNIKSSVTTVSTKAKIKTAIRK